MRRIYFSTQIFYLLGDAIKCKKKSSVSILVTKLNYGLVFRNKIVCKFQRDCNSTNKTLFLLGTTRYNMLCNLLEASNNKYSY